MKALVLTQNAKLEIKDIEEEKLKPTDCRIKITYAGICSSDIGRAYSGAAYFYPLVMGHEITGVVTKTGSKVTRFSVGDRVAVFPVLPCFSCPSCQREEYAQCHNYSYYGSRRHGGFCQFLVVPEWNLLKLSKAVDDLDAVALEPMAVVIHALKKTGIFSKKPKRMAILGGGFLGLLATHIIRQTCPEVELTVIDPNSEKLNLIKREANTIAIKTADEWKTFFDSKQSFDIVLVATGNPKSFEYSINLINHGGTVVWMGNISGDLMLNQKTVSSVLRKELTIQGTWNSLYRPTRKDDWKMAIQLIKKGIHPKDLISHRISLDEAVDIFEKLHKHKTRQKSFPSVKVVVDLNKT